MARAPVGDLSGPFWNQVEDDAYNEYEETVEMLVDDMMAAGYPPFAEPMQSPRDQYQALLALKVANSDLFWGSPEAQATFERLSARYGV